VASGAAAATDTAPGFLKRVAGIDTRMPFPALSPASSDVTSPANAAATVAAGLVTATAGVTRNLEVMTQNAFRYFLNAFDTRA